MPVKALKTKSGLYYSVKVWFTPKELEQISRFAQMAGKRPTNCDVFVQNKDSFNGEKLANTKGISKFLKGVGLEWAEIQLAKRKYKEWLQKENEGLI